MKKKSLVSIIINNYNYEKFLREAINSALSQTYSQKEVIVVDDGSTDGSNEIIKSYGSQIKSVLKDNGGQGSTFSAGFNASNGDFICFLDADDLLFQTTIESAVPLFDLPNTVKVHWPMYVIDEKNERNGKMMPKEPPLEGDRRQTVISDGPFHNWHLNPPTSGNMWARWFLDKVLPMPEQQFRLGADGYLHTLSPIYGTVRTLNEPQGSYRIHSNNRYFKKKLDNKTVSFYQRRFENYFYAFQDHFKRQGVEIDNETWKKKNFNYLWLQRLREAREDIQLLVPKNSSLILIDGNELGEQFVQDYDIIPFLEKNGEYWGQPENDEAAIIELKRLQQAGVNFLVCWWTAFWSLEHYKGFSEHLLNEHSCLLENDRVRIYKLKDSIVV